MMTIEDLKKTFGEEAVATIRQDVTAEVEADYQSKLTEIEKEYHDRVEAETTALKEDNRKMMESAIDQWRKEQKPPDQEDISKVLNQEYLTFTVKLPWGSETKEFVIHELPMGTERKIYSLIRDKLLPRLKDIQLVDLQQGDIEEQAKALFNVLDPAMDILSEAVAIVLNPRGQEPTVTSQWVQDNLSSYRIWNILTAQMEVNRLRDFFSGVSLSSRRGTMSLARTLR